MTEETFQASLLQCKKHLKAVESMISTPVHELSIIDLQKYMNKLSALGANVAYAGGIAEKLYQLRKKDPDALSLRKYSDKMENMLKLRLNVLQSCLATMRAEKDITTKEF